jgi:hypothetical protein
VAGGPVDYAECGLSERLIRDLKRWELGEGFEVEFRSYENGVGVRGFRGKGPGSPAAAAAFSQLTADMRKDREQLARLKADDEVSSAAGGWFAYAPHSGAVFRPRSQGGGRPGSRDAADRGEE